MTLAWIGLLGAPGCGDDDGSAVDAGGGGGMDAGGGRTDAGSAGADAGSGGTDAGGPRTDGSVVVVDGGGRADAGGSATDAGGPSCATAGESCLSSPCCGAGNCCSGMPIPAGMAVCYDTICPRSDRNLKEGFEDVDGEEILEGVAQLPISRWSYVADPPGVRHVGPMAQDFQQTFDVGASDRMIFQIDADGVALASIQALERRTTALRVDNERLRHDNDSLRARLDAIESRLAGRARR